MQPKTKLHYTGQHIDRDKARLIEEELNVLQRIKDDKCDELFQQIAEREGLGPFPEGIWDEEDAWYAKEDVIFKEVYNHPEYKKISDELDEVIKNKRAVSLWYSGYETVEVT